LNEFRVQRLPGPATIPPCSEFKETRMDEQELILRVRDGDQEAFARIMEIYKDRIVNYLYQFTRDYQRAVDLSQETFLRVYFKADRYKPIAPLSSWIYAIASNLAKTDARNRRRMATVPLDDVPNSYNAGTYSEDPAGSGMVRNLREALEALHPRYRIPVVLKDMEGLSQEEIARIIKRPVGTVKARISRGREHLRKMLESARGGDNGPAKKEVNEHG
jgi:RNA polymerase sigma-70 factor (ECF subfamily)